MHEYPHGGDRARAAGDRARGCRRDWALQDPEDYLEVLRDGGARGASRRPASTPADVVGIATDFTASTPLPVLADGTPLCRARRARASARTPTRSCGSTTPRRRRPTASTRSPRERGEPWLARYGGRISSEWEFAKALQVLEEDPEVYERMDRWIEAADWIVWQLCGVETRNVCTAGYKGIHQDGGYPSRGLPARARRALRRLRRGQARGPAVARSARAPAA